MGAGDSAWDRMAHALVTAVRSYDCSTSIVVVVQLWLALRVRPRSTSRRHGRARRIDSTDWGDSPK
eukprot:26117-Prymnesium_polylepis.1